MRRMQSTKLLNSKWTAVTPVNKEKHFIVTRLNPPEPPSPNVQTVELEAVYTQRTVSLPIQALADKDQWQQGWQ